MNWKFNFKKNTTAVKPKSKAREWLDAIGYAVLFSPKFRVAPKFKPGITKPASPTPTEE
ncbi:MAG: hypothetical protein JWQ34_417 [Mucilaginibacter sp.]|uniref:hypothetical protein n=1 Tax=Mucilaginibacter sp. TaxID=1882438 RepID=UPI0026392931|nr:hypothetical protein [Mucilaginibacter sp.]MDB5002192.1 hypothetical protein [Mucilaginibacter sp.]